MAKINKALKKEYKELVRLRRKYKFELFMLLILMFNSVVLPIIVIINYIWGSNLWSETICFILASTFLMSFAYSAITKKNLDHSDLKYSIDKIDQALDKFEDKCKE